MKVLNRDTHTIEKAKIKLCPRCKGFGAVVSDPGIRCHLCKGHGSIWVSVTGSGWIRARFDRVFNSKLY